MSSKYHWTQELTNPQDRFRLYQHSVWDHYDKINVIMYHLIQHFK